MKHNYKSKMVAPWFSSYEENNFGDLFYGLVRVYQPKKVVELGTKAGYSAYHIARALKANGSGTLDCHDLWEEYEFNSVEKAVAEKNLEEFKDITKFYLGDVTKAVKQYGKIDILHIDLGNHAESMEKIIPKWIGKVNQLIIMEGGSKEHDELEWMKKYKKKPLAPWLQKLQRKYKGIEYLTVDKFPSLTLIRKK